MYVGDEIGFMEDGIPRYLNDLGKNKSAGPDDIHPAIVKQLASCSGPIRTQEFLRRNFENAAMVGMRSRGSSSEKMKYKLVS